MPDVLVNFRKMCLKIYHLDPEKFLSAPGLAWQAALKKTEVMLESLTDIDMLLMVEERIDMQKLITSIRKIVIKIIIS